jgi:hypothetical protein
VPPASPTLSPRSDHTGRQPSFELSAWDGRRWVLEQAFTNSTEALEAAQRMLARRKGVKVTEEIYDEGRGIFRSRTLHMEYRDGAEPRRPPPPSRPAAIGVNPAPAALSRATVAPRNDGPFYVAVAALIVAVATLVVVVATR